MLAPSNSDLIITSLGPTISPQYQLNQYSSQYARWRQFTNWKVYHDQTLYSMQVRGYPATAQGLSDYIDNEGMNAGDDGSIIPLDIFDTTIIYQQSSCVLGWAYGQDSGYIDYFNSSFAKWPNLSVVQGDVISTANNFGFPVSNYKYTFYEAPAGNIDPTSDDLQALVFYHWASSPFNMGPPGSIKISSLAIDCVTLDYSPHPTPGSLGFFKTKQAALDWFFPGTPAVPAPAPTPPVDPTLTEPFTFFNFREGGKVSAHSTGNQTGTYGTGMLRLWSWGDIITWWRANYTNADDFLADFWKGIPPVPDWLWSQWNRSRPDPTTTPDVSNIGLLRPGYSFTSGHLPKAPGGGTPADWPPEVTVNTLNVNTGNAGPYIETGTGVVTPDGNWWYTGADFIQWMPNSGASAQYGSTVRQVGRPGFFDSQTYDENGLTDVPYTVNTVDGTLASTGTFNYVLFTYNRQPSDPSAIHFNAGYFKYTDLDLDVKDPQGLADWLWPPPIPPIDYKAYGVHWYPYNMWQGWVVGTVDGQQLIQTIRTAPTLDLLKLELGIGVTNLPWQVRASRDGKWTMSWQGTVDVVHPYEGIFKDLIDGPLLIDPHLGMPVDRYWNATMYRTALPDLAWKFNPWTGIYRQPEDIANDPQGLLIT